MAGEAGQLLSLINYSDRSSGLTLTCTQRVGGHSKGYSPEWQKVTVRAVWAHVRPQH